MPNNNSKTAEEAAGVIGTARDVAQSAYDAGKGVYEHADHTIDELSKFGKQRPLLAMGVAFAAGYIIASVFRR